MADNHADSFRIEPILSDPELATGLQMAVADPAWMLSRQRLFGELTGEDAGSPASARLWMETRALSTFTTLSGQSIELKADAPLEACIENEWQPRVETSAQFAALAGRQYGRELETALTEISSRGHRALPSGPLDGYWQALLQKYPLAPAAGPLGALAAGRVPDGQKLYADLDKASPRLPSDPPLTATDPRRDTRIEAVRAAAARFLAWYKAASGRLLPEAGAWSPERLEYQGKVNAANVVLSFHEYDSGRLDWYSFDVADESEPWTSTPNLTPRTLLPAPVTFRGMPAARLWEFEDGAVDLGVLRAEPNDVAAMLVVEFALRYGNDFFLIPLRLAAGTVSRVGALIVTDTFGASLLIQPAAERDSGLRVFEHKVHGKTSMFVCPAAPDGPESAPLEEVVLARDEGANICWAIEKIALGSSGLPEDRTPHAAALVAPPAAASGTETLRYRFRTRVADNWYPLRPPSRSPENRDETGRLPSLVLGRVHALPGGDPAQSSPWGRVLAELDRVALPDEEVTRDGHRIVRAWRYAAGLQWQRIPVGRTAQRPGAGDGLFGPAL